MVMHVYSDEPMIAHGGYERTEINIPKFKFSEDLMTKMMLERIDDLERIQNSEKLESVRDFGIMYDCGLSKDIDYDGDPILKGLNILKKYTEKVVESAERDIIYGPRINACIDKGITVDDCLYLIDLGWELREEEFCYCI